MNNELFQLINATTEGSMINSKQEDNERGEEKRRGKKKEKKRRRRNEIINRKEKKRYMVEKLSITVNQTGEKNWKVQLLNSFIVDIN